jgi:hypothetical protein
LRSQTFGNEGHLFPKMGRPTGNEKALSKESFVQRRLAPKRLSKEQPKVSK